MERFSIDLKTFLGLAIPNQCSQTVWLGTDVHQPATHIALATIAVNVAIDLQCWSLYTVSDAYSVYCRAFRGESNP